MTRFKKICGIIGVFLLLVTVTVTAGPVDLNDPVFADFNRILFVKGDQGRVIPYHMVDQYFGYETVLNSGNGLFILENAFRGTSYVTDVLDGSYCTNGRYEGQQLTGGGFLAPNLSYDGTKIVFCYTDGNQTVTWNVNTTYHIFTVNLDGTNLTQLTDGIYNDLHPAFMPDGRIIFISERRGGYGRCHGRSCPTYTLHTMNDDGSDIRCISYHETNEWWPAIDNFGMVVYTRWDYVDRGATHCHSGWITKTDGHNARPISLNYTNMGEATSWGFGNIPLMQAQIKPIPNSDKYVATAASHHWRCFGSIILIDPNVEDDDQNATITNITPDNNGYPESGGGGHKYGSPWALSEDFFLVTYSSADDQHYSLYAIDSAENKTLLYDDPNVSSNFPIPIKSRSIPNAYHGSEAPSGAPSDGVMNLVNVYNTLLPFPDGTTITHLRIWEPYVKPNWYANTPCVSYESTESGAAGRNVKGLIGTVPVETDGSARFYLPANAPYYFQALNADGIAVQSMRSDVYFVGGQKSQYCSGCHEPRHQATINPSVPPTAFLRAPSTITPDPVLLDDSQQPNPFFSYPRYIQPILDSKCITCHDGSQTPDLRQGTPDTRGWFASYTNLKPYVWLLQTEYPGSNWDRVYPRTEPGQFGAMDSPLYTRLEGGHGSVSADELHTFVIWLDSGMGQYYGAYTDTSNQNNGNIVEPLYH
jgi:hypothetical protein